MTDPVPGERPIGTVDSLHPFDGLELHMIRYVAKTHTTYGEPLLTIDYARTMLPAMADKIEQLRVLLADRDRRLAAAHQLFQEMRDRAATMREVIDNLAEQDGEQE